MRTHCLIQSKVVHIVLGVCQLTWGLCGRTLSALYREAVQFDEEAAISAMERAETDGEAAARLWDIVNGGRDEGQIPADRGTLQGDTQPETEAEGQLGGSDQQGEEGEPGRADGFLTEPGDQTAILSRPPLTGTLRAVRTEEERNEKLDALLETMRKANELDEELGMEVE
ncbi:MAG: hypothetical protein D6717_07300 [Gammaproteobacteria bacterium]|nr:MAG: hypothetical protein D6717_07300 [Gammaproteobacteria bacterium]